MTHQRVYDEARCYDVAFGFRNVGAECDTLAALVARHGRPHGPVTALLELAAGPAHHAREFVRRGAAATALDVQPAMCEYARIAAAADHLALDVVCADMIDFDIDRRFDLAVLLMDSASYLLDNGAVLRHLESVARHVRAGGLYVLEMSHPRDAFGVGASTHTRWVSESVDGLRVEMQWGAEGDPFDPVTQIDEVTVTMAWSGPQGSGELVERSRQRRCTANEFDALVRASGVFAIVEWLGSLAPPVAFGNEPGAWRMVPVLRRL